MFYHMELHRLRQRTVSLVSAHIELQILPLLFLFCFFFKNSCRAQQNTRTGSKLRQSQVFESQMSLNKDVALTNQNHVIPFYYTKKQNYSTSFSCIFVCWII